MCAQVTGAVALEDDVRIGSGAAADVRVDDIGLCAHHACVLIQDGKYYLVDRDSEKGTWLNGKRLRSGEKVQLHPGDFLAFGGLGAAGRTFKVKQMHLSQRAQGLLASNEDGSARRYKVSYREDRQTASA